MTLKITKQQKQQYQDEGYLILDRVIPNTFLKLLQDECQAFVDQVNLQMDQKGTDVLGINPVSYTHLTLPTILLV